MESLDGSASTVFDGPITPRVKVLLAAVKLFHDQGFDRTTVRDLAKEVGIQSGSLFHHFSSKNEILHDVMKEVIVLNTRKLREAFESTTDPSTRLLAMIKAELWSILGPTGPAMHILIFEWRSLDEGSQQNILEMRKVYEDIWLEAIGALPHHSELGSSSFVLRKLLLGALSWTSSWFSPSGEMSVDELAETVHRLFH